MRQKAHALMCTDMSDGFDIEVVFALPISKDLNLHGTAAGSRCFSVAEALSGLNARPPATFVTWLLLQSCAASCTRTC